MFDNFGNTSFAYRAIAESFRIEHCDCNFRAVESLCLVTGSLENAYLAVIKFTIFFADFADFLTDFPALGFEF